MKANQRRNWFLATLVLTTLLAPIGASRAQAAASTNFLDLQDVSSTQLSYIKRAVELDLVHGDTSGTFRPTDKLTRQELAVLLTQALQLPLTHQSVSFSDVDTNGWGSRYIEAVRSAGIMSGDGDGTFRPNDLINREEMAVLLVRASQQTLEPAADQAAATDWQGISSWAQPYVRTALKLGAMKTNSNQFAPSNTVQRQDVAEMLVETFFPTDRPAMLQAIKGDRVQINGVTYKTSARVAGVLNESNQAALERAEIKFDFTDRTIDRLTALHLHAGGTAPHTGEAEFQGNLVLDGQGATLDGDLLVAADYLSLKNLNVAGNFKIGQELENDFYATHLNVQGKVTISGGDENTVVFEDSQMQAVDVDKKDVHVVAQGSTSIQEMNLQSNASVTTSSTSTLNKVTVGDGAQQVDLTGSVGQVVVASTQPTTLTGTATINTITINSAAAVTLNNTGQVGTLQVNNQNSKVQLSSASKVSNVSLAAGVPSSSVTSPNTAAPNTKPKLITPVGDRLITLGDATLMTIDLSQYFLDPEQAVLKFTATSAKTSIVTVSVVGNILTLTPVGKGTTNILLSADDLVGGITTGSFKLTVNTPPAAASGGVPTQTKSLTTGDVVVNLNSWFLDDDGDVMTYTATIDDPTIATLQPISGGVLTLNPLKMGTTTVHVKAVDGRGGEFSESFQVTVTKPPNAKPEIQTPPSNQTLLLGGTDYTLDLSTVFKDPEGLALTFDAQSTNSATATATLNGSLLTVHPLVAGSTKIQLKATDPEGLEEAASFDVAVNTAPTVNAISAQSIQVGDAPTMIDLSSYMHDADNDALTITATPADLSIVTTSLTGNQLSLTGVHAGSTTITVTISDGRGGSATTTLNVHVNEKPSVQQAPSNQLLTVGTGDYTLDLSTVFKDSSDDVLTYTAVSLDSAKATATLNGSLLTVHPLASGSAQIQLKATDTKGVAATANFDVTVNEAPTVDALPAKKLQIGDVATVDLASYLHDVEHDALTVTAAATDPSLVSTELTGNQLKLTALQGGATTITITVNDGRGGSTTATIAVTVNQKPIVLQAPSNQNLTVGKGDYTLDLSTVFKDPENLALAFEASSLNTAQATATLNGSVLTVHPVASGTAQIQLKATDVDGIAETASFDVSVNEAPTVDALPAQTISAGDTTMLDLTPYLHDTDNDALTITATSADATRLTTSVTGNQLSLNALKAGSTTVTVTVNDGRGGVATQTLSITVLNSLATNQKPIVQAPPSNKMLTVGAADYTLDLSTVFQDPDNDALTYEVTSLDPALASAVLSGSQLTVHALAAGTVTIELKATDSFGASETASFDVAVNLAPTIDTLPAQSLQAGDPATKLDLAPYLHDADNDALTLSVTSANSAIATATITNQELSVTALAAGQTTLTVTANDGRGGTTTATITVNVTAAPSTNKAPTVVASIYEQVLSAGVTNPRSYDLTQLFQDDDGDALTFTAVVSDPQLATATISGGLITLSPGTKAGSGTITVTADDGRGGTATYVIKVRNAPTVANGFVEIRTKQGVPSVTYDLSTMFPGQTSFTVYEGTPDSTFTGPTTMNGNVWTGSASPLYVWVIGANGQSVVFHVTADPQGAPDLFFSEYLDGGDGRIALELYYKQNGPVPDGKGYTLEVYQYMKKTNTMKVWSKPIFEQWPTTRPYIFIDTIFYDAFDIMPIWYYNDELDLYNPTEFNTVALVLKKNGQVIDKLGDPTSHNQFLPNGGTIIRKQGVYTGSQNFSLYGEWNIFPKGTYQFMGNHTL